MTETILVINAGSSSIKFQLFLVAQNEVRRALRGQIEGIGVRPRLIAKNTEGEAPIEEEWPVSEVATVPQALDKLVAFLRERLGTLPVAIGHRVVHGGPDYSDPTVIDDGVIERLEKFTPLAPLHQPNNLAPIRAVRARQQQLLQVACFDTAFHRNHPEIADRYALPEQFYAEGVRRYGFHGLSYEYIAGRLPEIAPEIARGRVIVAHLGSGASMCALSAGKSVESTLGFTALDGLPMGTRPGQLDPGVVLYLIAEKGMTPAAVQDLFYRDSGLKGLSGVSNDVRELEKSADPKAAFALEYFVYRSGLLAGMLAAALGGLDAFVFTAGIGENSPTMRSRIAERLAWLGVSLDTNANAAGATVISRKDSRIAVYVIPTNEELMIARHTLKLIGHQRGPQHERAAE